MLNLTSHEGNTNHNEILFCAHWGGYNKRQELTNAGEDTEELEHTRVHGWWARQVVQPLEKSLSILRKLSLGLPYDLAIPFTGIYSVEQKIHVQTNTHMQMFTAALFIIAKMGKQPTVH